MLKLKYLSSLLAVMALAAAELNIVSKSNWNGLDARDGLTNLDLPVQRVVIAHTAGSDCTDEESCAERVKSIQNYHMNVNHFSDIAYNFLIGNDGNIYEGRGWNQEGAFAQGYNAGSLGITFIGTFTETSPTEKALNAAKSLLEQGIQLGKISADYKLIGHRQIVATNSPGDALYKIIKQWPHWTINAKN